MGERRRPDFGLPLHNILSENRISGSSSNSSPLLLRSVASARPACSDDVSMNSSLPIPVDSVPSRPRKPKPMAASVSLEMAVDSDEDPRCELHCGGTPRALAQLTHISSAPPSQGSITRARKGDVEEHEGGLGTPASCRPRSNWEFNGPATSSQSAPETADALFEPLDRRDESVQGDDLITLHVSEGMPSKEVSMVSWTLSADDPDLLDDPPRDRHHSIGYENEPPPQAVGTSSPAATASPFKSAQGYNDDSTEKLPHDRSPSSHRCTDTDFLTDHQVPGSPIVDHLARLDWAQAPLTVYPVLTGPNNRARVHQTPPGEGATDAFAWLQICLNYPTNDTGDAEGELVPDESPQLYPFQATGKVASDRPIGGPWQPWKLKVAATTASLASTATATVLEPPRNEISDPSPPQSHISMSSHGLSESRRVRSRSRRNSAHLDRTSTRSSRFSLFSRPPTEALELSSGSRRPGRDSTPSETKTRKKSEQSQDRTPDRRRSGRRKSAPPRGSAEPSSGESIKIGENGRGEPESLVERLLRRLIDQDPELFRQRTESRRDSARNGARLGKEGYDRRKIAPRLGDSRTSDSRSCDAQSREHDSSGRSSDGTTTRPMEGGSIDKRTTDAWPNDKRGAESRKEVDRRKGSDHRERVIERRNAQGRKLEDRPTPRSRTHRHSFLNKVLGEGGILAGGLLANGSLICGSNHMSCGMSSGGQLSSSGLLSGSILSNGMKPGMVGGGPQIPHSILADLDCLLRGVCEEADSQVGLALDERDLALVERDQAYADRDDAVRERVEACCERDQALAERDQAYADRDTAYAESDLDHKKFLKTIRILENALNEQEKKLRLDEEERRKEDLGRRNDDLEKRHDEDRIELEKSKKVNKKLEVILTQWEKSFDHLKSHAEKREDQLLKLIQDQENQLKLKDQLLAGKEVLLKDKDVLLNEFRDREAELRQRELQLRERESELREKESEAREKELEIRDREADVRDRESEVREKEAEISMKEISLRQSELMERESETKSGRESAIEKEAEERLRMLKKKNEVDLNNLDNHWQGIVKNLNQIIHDQRYDFDHRMTYSDQRLKEAESRLKDSDQQLRGTEFKLKEADQRLKELGQRLAEADQRLKDVDQQLKDTVTSNEARLAEKEKHLREAEKRLKEAEQILREAEHKTSTRVRELEQHLREAEAKNKDLEGEIKELQSMIKNNEEEIENNLHEINRLKLDCEELASGLHKTKKAYDHLRKKEANGGNNASAPNASTTGSSTITNSSAAEDEVIHELKSVLSTTQDEREDLKRQVAKLTSKLQQVEKSIMDKDVAITIKAKMLDEQSAYLSKMRDKLSNTEQLYSEAKFSMQKMEDALKKRGLTFNGHSLVANGLRNCPSACSNAGDFNDDNGSSYEQLINENMRLRKELSDRVKTLDMIAEEIEDIKKTRLQEEKRREAESDEFRLTLEKSAESRIETLTQAKQAEIDALKDRIHTLEQRLQTSLGLLDERQRTINSLEQDLQRVRSAAAEQLSQLARDLAGVRNLPLE